MTVKEYLEATGKNKHTNICFVIEKAVKDTHSPFYHEEYTQTPIRNAYEWLLDDCRIKDYIVLNGEQPPICHITCKGWINHYSKGLLECMLITTEEDIRKHYSKEQAEEMLEMYDREIRKSIE